MYCINYFQLWCNFGVYSETSPFQPMMIGWPAKKQIFTSWIYFKLWISLSPDSYWKIPRKCQMSKCLMKSVWNTGHIMPLSLWFFLPWVQKSTGYPPTFKKNSRLWKPLHTFPWWEPAYCTWSASRDSKATSPNFKLFFRNLRSKIKCLEKVETMTWLTKAKTTDKKQKKQLAAWRDRTSMNHMEAHRKKPHSV